MKALIGLILVFAVFVGGVVIGSDGDPFGWAAAAQARAAAQVAIANVQARAAIEMAKTQAETDRLQITVDAIQAANARGDRLLIGFMLAVLLALVFVAVFAAMFYVIRADARGGVGQR